MEQGWPGLAQYTCAVPADWSPRPRTVQDALDQLAARTGGSGISSSFVYRPGGVAAPGVYVTSAALLAAVSADDTAADKVVSVDASLATVPGTAHIAGGPWPDNITWQSGKASELAVLVLDDTTDFAGLTYRFRDIAVQMGNTTPVMTIPLGAAVNLVLERAIFAPVGAGNIFADVAGTLSLKALSSLVGSGTAGHEIFEVESTGTMVVLGIGGSSFNANTVKQGTAPGGALGLQFDGSCQSTFSMTQVPVPGPLNFNPVSTFVFAPSAASIPAANVFTTSATLIAAMALCPGAKTVVIDDTLAAAHITAGGPYDFDLVHWMWKSNPTGTGTLHIDIGATFTMRTMTIDGVIFQNDNTAVPCTCNTAGDFFYVKMIGDFPEALSSTAVALFRVQNAGGFVLENNGGQVGDGTHPVITTDAGQSSTVALFLNSTLSANALAGLGTTQTNVFPSGTASRTQTVTTLTYAWGDPPNFQQASGNTGTTTGTVSSVTPNIAKKRSGSVSVSGLVSGVISGAGTVTVSLLRDATPIGHAVPYVALATATGFSIPVNFIDTLPDFANHTYTVQAVASAGTIVTAANGAQIEAQEL